MTHAVIRTGGKQYLVTKGSRVRVDKLESKEGEKLTFSDVLLTVSDTEAEVGAPVVAGVKVDGKVVKQGRYPKVFGVKMKAKKRSKKYFGHKQHFTEIEITGIKAGK